MQPLCNILNMPQNNILGVSMVEIDHVLTANRGIEMSSYEVFPLLPLALQTQLDQIASQYPRGGCASSKAYVGAAAAELASRGTSNISHNPTYRCPILHKIEDSFKKI